MNLQFINFQTNKSHLWLFENLNIENSLEIRNCKIENYFT